MKKVVAFIGSPRRNGNVATLVKEIVRGASEAGAETKIYHLNDLNLRGCQSCMFCREHESCCLKDDYQSIFEEIKTADALVLGSPIYILQVSGQMKTLLDRFYPLTDKQHKPRFGIKKTVMVYTYGVPIPFMFRRYMSYNNKALKAMGIRVTKTIIGMGAYTPDAISKKNRLLHKAFNVGKALVR